MNPSGVWLKVSLTDGVYTSLGITATRAEISPNGSKIAYLKSGHLYVRNLSGGAIRDFGAATDFAWSPSSATLAIFSSHLTMQSATTGVGMIIYAGTGSKPTWSPDGSKIAFIKSTGGIFVVGSTGGAVTAIPGTSKASEVHWQP